MYENNKHMNADEIYAKVKDKSIGISTVYRNPIMLEHIGILKRINTINSTSVMLLGMCEKYSH